jgi:GAF domain-containing protein
MLYAYAMHKSAAEAAAGVQRRRIPMPGLANPESQLGVPLIVRGELIGVLYLESEAPYRFHEEDKASIELLGSYLAIALQNMQVQERSADAALEAPNPAPVRGPGARLAAANGSAARARRDVVYYAGDECILLDGEYLIRSLPAKILWRLLMARESTGRQEFTNRELRLDKSLNLPEWKDNLESRLILLRRRLDEKCPDIRLVPRARGRFALELSCDVALSVRP